MTYLNELNDILQAWGENVVERIKTNLDNTNTTASGKTKESLEVVVDNAELTIYGRQYFQGVEKGRPAGRIPWKFQDIIRKWMDDKGIASQFGDTESKKRSAAWNIAQFIKNNGTRLYLSGGRDDIYTNVINEELPKLEGQISMMVADTIVENLQG